MSTLLDFTHLKYDIRNVLYTAKGHCEMHGQGSAQVLQNGAERMRLAQWRTEMDVSLVNQNRCDGHQ